MKKKLLMLVLVVIVLNVFVSKPAIVYAQSTVSNPVRVWDENGFTNQDCIVTWDCLYFGNYPQSDVTGESKEKIKWQVLSVDEDGVALLMATQNLDVYVYDEGTEGVTWENSDVRSWLNSTFLNNAFSIDEQAAIAKNNAYQDSVFLLSKEEACNGKYGLNIGDSYLSDNNSRIRTNTAYAAAVGSANGMNISEASQANGWWLRTVDEEDSTWAYVDEEGNINSDGISANGLSNAICPVIYLDLNETDLWEKTDSISRESDLFFSSWNDGQCGSIHFGWNLDMTCYVWGIDDDAVGHVVIPNEIEWEGTSYTVSTITNNGFQNCKDMTSIKIPSSIASIPDNAFDGCDEGLIICGDSGSCAETFAQEKGYSFTTDDSDLQTIIVEENGVYYLLIKNKKEAYVNGYDYDQLIENNGVVTIDSSLTFDGIEYQTKMVMSNAFVYAMNLVEVVIPEGVTSIRSSAFEYCSNLKKVTLPNTITELRGCFAYCESLENITIPREVTYIDWSTFANCKNLKEIKIPDTVKIINGSAFYACDSLVSVTIPSNVETIGMYAFDECENLKDVYIYNSEASIGYYALGEGAVIHGYKNSTAQRYAEEHGMVFKILGEEEHTFSEEYTIDTPATCAKSGSKSRHCTDEGCTEKTDVTEIPATGQHTYDAGVMKTLPTCVAAGEKIYTCTGCGQTKTEAVAATGTHTYSEWTETKAATGDVAGEKTRTCSVCAHQETETIPAMGYVKGAEFSKGKNTYTIKSVKGKKGTVIYEGTEKTSKKVSVPKTVKVDGKTYTVTEIAEDAFKDNTKITSVTIPEGVTKIGKNAFSGCKKLKTITIKSTKLKTVGKNAIKGIDKNATIKVPSKQLSKYQKLFKSSTGFKKTMKIKK